MQFHDICLNRERLNIQILKLFLVLLDAESDILHAVLISLWSANFFLSIFLFGLESAFEFSNSDKRGKN